LLIDPALRELLYREDKLINGADLIWVSLGSQRTLSAPVHRLNGEQLLLRGVVRKKFSFALLYKGVIPIRWFDLHRHKNPDGDRIVGPHKHPKSDRQSVRWAYRVHDIPISDPEEALLSFLRECNIKIVGVYSYQLRLRFQ